MTAPQAPAAAAPPETLASSREELLKLLDREAAIARATGGRLAVLILELRRVDRLQALLRGPAPATTMALVIDRLHKALRDEDRMAAINDEEVCVILPRLAHPSQAVLAAVKVLRVLDRPIAHEGGSAVLRPCVGVATLPEHGFDPAGLLMAADVARHIAATREEGYHVFQGDESVETEVYRGLDLDLERALRANELDLHYQPIVDLATGRGVGVEALLRWRHPQAGDIPPATLVGIAERTGLMSNLSLWVLNAALRQAQQWRAARIEPRIAVNLSPTMLADSDLPHGVDQALRTFGMDPTRFTFEIGEGQSLGDAERSVATLTRLKALGVQIAVDDFGSGFTSLAHLKRFPVDEIKIDRPFVASLLDDPGDAAVVRTAIDLARNFSLRVVAEGVERKEVAGALAGLGCAFAQGFLFAKPLPEVALRDWWSTHGA
ncbi:MAG TPA: GGDEF domain-containing phosphodiesterase [Usitatibacter sp.]|jgi:predicted signal transduction protein with EAL and GGDEF domain|nr:GGDEF domain-containing phosphodiesterase [Usitatibacter sp.]